MNSDNTAQLQKKLEELKEHYEVYSNKFFVHDIEMIVADYISQLELPEKPSNSLIQMSLQNGKPQQAASYNNYAAAINDTTAILDKAVAELRGDGK